MKLWQKDYSIDEIFERFTIGDDPVLDEQLFYYDLLGTIAHVKMLGKIGLLTVSETESLVNELEKMKEEDPTISEGIEDCHSEIELRLTQRLGEVGKKVHSGRSRNDQVMTALKLFARDGLLKVVERVKVLFELWIEKADSHKGVLMPGYTHMQVAMPSSFGLWFGAYAESLVDDITILRAAYEVADRNPLGSAAGYGSSFPLDRMKTTEYMEFNEVNVNSVYASMTRGKMEKVVANALALIASTLSKYSTDIVLYSGQDFGFFNLDKKFTTGSSIMPHKKNPDGFELVRARCNQLQALPVELGFITTNLPVGYHRDLQMTKQHFVPAFSTLLDCIDIVIAMTKNLDVNKDLISASKYDLLFTVEEVNKRVLKGMAFRDAYKEVGREVESGEYKVDRTINHSHLGSIGNLGLEIIEDAFHSQYRQFQ